MTGKLAAIFGIDGSGKTTVVNRLSEHYESDLVKFKHAITDDLFSREVHAVFNELNASNTGPKRHISDGLRRTLWIDNIVWNTFTSVCPYLDGGINVVLDRYTLCVRAKLEIGTPEKYRSMAKMMECLPKPAVGIFMDVNAETAVERISRRNKKTWGDESITKLMLLRQKYEELMSHENYQIVRIDASETSDVVYKNVAAVLVKFGILQGPG